nr:hypothetical protein [Tanacetum cinerariifolium]
MDLPKAILYTNGYTSRVLLSVGHEATLSVAFAHYVTYFHYVIYIVDSFTQGAQVTGGCTIVSRLRTWLDYMPRPKYPEYLAPSDEEVPVKDQPYATADSPITLSLGYIADPNLEVDLEDESEDGDEEEEEHLALADSTAAAFPVLDLAPSTEGTEPFEIDESAVTPPPPPAYRTTTRMSIRAQTPIPFLSKAEVDRLLAMPTLPPSPLTLLTSPLPRIPSPTFPVPSPTTTSPTYTEAPLGYRAAGIRSSMVMMRAAAPSAYCLAPLSGTPPLLPIPLPTSSPPLLLPSTDCRSDVSEDPDEIVEEILATGVAELGQRMTNFVTAVRQDTDEIYSKNASDTARSEVRALRTMIFAQQIEIGYLWAADRKRHAQLIEALTPMRTFQTQMVALQS